MIRSLLLALAAVAAAPALADPPKPPAQEEVRIPFADFGGIRSFQAWSDDVVYLEDRHNQWYRAQLYGPCYGLGWAFGIGIDTGGSSTFDRFSRLIVGRERCPIQSLTRSDKPQKPWKKHKA
ncbi:MAG: hypothetical protein QOH04_1528 [Sphingomonadales bacterium]|jgi:hypothetical protein|nr:hypothetical protein [Sphingomonadales bacterium]